MSTIGAPVTVADPAPAETTGRGSFQVRDILRAAIVIAAALAAAASAAWSALNNDVTYAFGGLETAGAGGVSVWDVFVARPLAYRLLFALLDGGKSLLAGDASLSTAHVVLRAETWVLVAAVAAVLFLGMRRALGGTAGLAIAAATGLALIVSPPWHFLEPDWVAALVAVLAVGAAFAPKQVWLGGLLGGFAAFLAIAVKLATAPVAVLALLLVAVLGWRRSAWAAGSTVVFTLLWYASTKHFLPWEWTWPNDQAVLVENSPIHHGLRWADIHHLLIATGDVAILSPVVAVAPAAATVLVRRLEPGRRRAIGAAVAVVAAGLSVASAYGQGEFFMYHFAVVPVLAAGVWGAAFGLCPKARIPLAAVTLLAAAVSFVLLRQPAPWRLENVTAVAGLYAVGAALAAVAVALPAGRTSSSVPWTSGAFALLAALVLATLPKAPYAFSTYDYAIYNARPNGTGYPALRERIGPDTPVLYLSFGAVNYLLGNPTTCRYPSPQWLQRGSVIPKVRTFPSYEDNLRCLTEQHDAKYLVWQTGWFTLKRASPQVQSLLAARFDCSPQARIPAPAGLQVCPARPT